ncbi:histone deacetylase HOS3 [Pyrenophora seminiperda CCB06]|uniref:Histone deacetylase HOS3 n=1 Tax=Pyrenophora seminiperda CCB06 TaxID=1302712 RepID=A0A3M7MG94_9PLEO|nr:histone deacetylase HOS3 [Pyrenophora seminiperda CCB06]
MSNQQRSSPAASARPGTPRGARQTNNDANLLSHPLKRLSLHTPSNTPLPKSPAVTPTLRRTPSTPNFAGGNGLQRSPSVASFRSSTSALGRKASTSSLRGDMPRPGTPRGTASRRASFNPSMQSSIPKSPLGPAHPPEKPVLRACDVAEEYFKKELARHEGMAGAVNAGTLVIVHDQCYGHRYSRPKTPKGHLSLIMERPERILASVLGISTAYVRLGERHAEGNHPPHPTQSPPARIPFKIRKTSRVVDITSQVVTNVHGTKWMNELKSLCDNAERKLATTGKELARDTPAVSGRGPKQQELHSGDLYLCSESLNAFQGALGGVLDAVDAVFQGTSMGEGPSRAFVCIRPPGHHCSDNFPSGFCWLNNVHVGIEHAMMQYGVTHAAIIDIDLHHGDGSQAITWARNKKVQNMPKNTPNWKKTSIGYFSLHDINSYPCEDGDDDKVQAASLCIDNAHGQSVWNIHLQSWETPEQFWAIYEEKYMVLLEKTRQYLKHHTQRLRNTPNHPAPKAVIFLSTGFDASEWETAGMQRHSVNVPTEFYARFTRDVVRLAEEEGTSVDGRVISVLEGGYSDRALTSGVFSHLSGLVDGQVVTEVQQPRGLGFSIQPRQRLSGLSIQSYQDDDDEPMQSVEAEIKPVTYDPKWWHVSHLAELENLIKPPPSYVPKAPRVGPPAHFSSPTQSYVAKVVDPSKLNRNLSAKYASPSRPITPPPPDVDWATAAHALSSLLIPSDRQTRSHQPEDLMEVKVKKEKPVVTAPSAAHGDGSGRQLRGRKPALSYAERASEEENASRANRRQTIADFAPNAEAPAPPRSAVRRMSIASSVSSIGDGRSGSRTPNVPACRANVAPSAPANGVPVRKPRGQTAVAAARAPQRPVVSQMPSNQSLKTSAVKGKENDGLDALTSGLKRITLKMPTKEEYDAREKEREEKKAAEAPKKTTTRKTPAARAPAAKPAAKATTTTKKGPGRPVKPSKPVSPAKASTPAPEAPQMQSTANAPLEQPRPMSMESASVLPHESIMQPFQDLQSSNDPPAVDRRISGGLMQPPTDLHNNMDMTPEQLREQLPMPSFVTVTEPLTDASPPPRADTPPPPPPSSIPHFINYTAQNFGSTPTFASEDTQSSATLQWVANTHAETTEMPGPAAPMSLSSPPRKKQDLPVFTANGAIPFAEQQQRQG